MSLIFFWLILIQSSIALTSICQVLLQSQLESHRNQMHLTFPLFSHYWVSMWIYPSIKLTVRPYTSLINSRSTIPPIFVQFSFFYLNICLLLFAVDTQTGAISYYSMNYCLSIFSFVSWFFISITLPLIRILILIICNVLNSLRSASCSSTFPQSSLPSFLWNQMHHLVGALLSAITWGA